ncbi:MAG: glycosyltransferase family 2 protein [Calditrichia bacterium]
MKTEDDVFLSVVIPVYNEINTLEEIIRRVEAAPYRKELIIVDDCSTDGSREFLQSLKKEHIRVFYHEKNMGKGAALNTGFKHCAGNLVIVQDADLEYDPAEYPKLVMPVLKHGADVVYGSRFTGEGPHRVHLFWHYVGNKLLTLFSNMFSNLNLTDMETCYKLFRREVLQNIQIESRGFGVEPELTIKISRLGVKIFEVGISYSGRNYEEGKKITWKDGVVALWTILKFGLFRRNGR